MKRHLVCAGLALFGCATATSNTAPAPAPVSPEPAVASTEIDAPPAPQKRVADEASASDGTPTMTRELPTECTGEAPCVPPPEFAESMCKGKYPGVALLMFEKSSPWQRKWVNVRALEAVNAFGGPNSGGELTFGEEVVLLRRQSASQGGMQISGGEDVEVLRWNGTCVTVRESELVEYVPGLPRNARIVWNYLGEPMQEALLTNKTVAEARKTHKKECHGSSRRSMTPSCEKATGSLNGAIVVAVRKGMPLPMPDKRPEWANLASERSLAAADSH